MKITTSVKSKRLKSSLPQLGVSVHLYKESRVGHPSALSKTKHIRLFNKLDLPRELQ